jgi:hypothetical protein
MRQPPWQCDKCGKFAKMEPGASQLWVPDSDVSYEEFGFRCKECTRLYGKPHASQMVNDDICAWVIQKESK